MRTSKLEGIVIKRSNFGEADRLLTVFTRRMGKIQVKAIGVRRIYSRRSSHTELLNHVIINLYQGRGMPILTEIESVGDFSFIKNNFEKIGVAYHICELIDKLCAYNQENSEVFSLLKDTLNRFSEGDIRAVVHSFEISLLTTLGFYTPDKHVKYFDTGQFIENIIERKLNTRQIFPLFLN